MYTMGDNTLPYNQIFTVFSVLLYLTLTDICIFCPERLSLYVDASNLHFFKTFPNDRKVNVNYFHSRRLIVYPYRGKRQSILCVIYLKRIWSYLATSLFNCLIHGAFPFCLISVSVFAIRTQVSTLKLRPSAQLQHVYASAAGVCNIARINAG